MRALISSLLSGRQEARLGTLTTGAQHLISRRRRREQIAPAIDASRAVQVARPLLAHLRLNLTEARLVLLQIICRLQEFDILIYPFSDTFRAHWR